MNREIYTVYTLHPYQYQLRTILSVLFTHSGKLWLLFSFFLSAYVQLYCYVQIIHKKFRHSIELVHWIEVKESNGTFLFLIFMKTEGGKRHINNNNRSKCIINSKKNGLDGRWPCVDYLIGARYC